MQKRHVAGICSNVVLQERVAGTCCIHTSRSWLILLVSCNTNLALILSPGYVAESFIGHVSGTKLCRDVISLRVCGCVTCPSNRINTLAN